jgi:hypothetical protein
MEIKFDETRAHREGWGLFRCDDGRVRIQRLDFPPDADASLPDEPLFKSDADAISFVVFYARSGSAYHQSALLFHGSAA